MYLIIPTPGGTLIFLYMCKLRQFLGVQNFEFQFFFFFRKMNIFWGMYEDFVDIFWGHHKIGLYLGVISMHFRDFSFQGTEWGIFLGVAKISNIV